MLWRVQVKWTNFYSQLQRFTSVNEYQTFRLPSFHVLKHCWLTWLPCCGYISWWTNLVIWIFKRIFPEHVILMFKIFIVRSMLWFIRVILQFELSVTCSSPKKKKVQEKVVANRDLFKTDHKIRFKYQFCRADEPFCS